MWIIIRKSDSTVVGTQYGIEPVWDSVLFEVKEWAGPEPPIHDPDADPPVSSYDPTLIDPDYATFTQSRVALDELEALATSEIAWLDAAIAAVDTADIAELRAMLKRTMQENRREIQAWRYVFRRLL